jgi:N utilization substance protein B
MDITHHDAADVIRQFTVHRFGHEKDGAYYDQADQPFFKDLVLGVVRSQRTVDPMIASRLAEGWRLARIDSILRAILRAGAYELSERRDVPAKVIINEYVDMAHAFFGGDEPAVVNGVLDAIARHVRPGEVKDRVHG